LEVFGNSAFGIIDGFSKEMRLISLLIDFVCGNSINKSGSKIVPSSVLPFSKAEK